MKAASKSGLSYEQLNNEQKLVVQSSGSVVVMANAGTGKTETLVHLIEKRVNDAIDDRKIFIASFTNRATSEIEFRVNKKVNSALIDRRLTFGTFDNFIYDQIIKFYLKRFINFTTDCFKYGKIAHPKFITASYSEKELFQGKMKESFDPNMNYDLDSDIALKWLEKYQSGVLIKGRVLEYLFLNFIKNSKTNIIKYIKTKFSTLILDEAQDVTIPRVGLLDYFFKNKVVDIVLVGDDKQTIYKFNGSISGVLDKISRMWDLQPMTLVTDMRITDSSLKISSFDDSKEKALFLMKNNISIDELISETKCENSALILCLKRKDLTRIASMLPQSNNFMLAEKFDPDWFNSLEEQDLFTNMILYYWKTSKSDVNMRIKSYLHNKKWHNNTGILNRIFEILSISDNYRKKVLFMNNLSNNVHIEPEKFLEFLVKEKYIFCSNNEMLSAMTSINHVNYFISEGNKRIMTLHSAKGLQADNVYIFNESLSELLTNCKNEELYVAMTRKKKMIKSFKI